MKKNIKHKFRQVKKLPDWLFLFPALFLKIYKLFMWCKVEDPYEIIPVGKTFATITWHNRLLFFPIMFPRHIRKQTCAVISASRDGQYIADLIKWFGLRAVRGSSSRKGANALAGAFKVIKQENNVSFTPDGPRGPKYTVGKGAVYLASQTGVKLLPISVNYSRYWQLKSWDNFQIPKPFSKVTLVVGKPLAVPPDLSDEELKEWQEKAREALLAITCD